MIRALIVDDEQLARRGLQIRLKQYDGVEVCGESRNGREAIADVRRLSPDLVFLDVQMPGMDGFEVLERLSGPELPAIVFVTAYNEFALRAFEAHALDYLLKPINDERLEEAVDRARQSLRDKQSIEHRNRLLKLVCDLTGRELDLDEALAEFDNPSQQYPERLAIRDNGKTSCIDIDDIDWIDAAGDYMCVHVNGNTLVMRGTMKKLEATLDPNVFVRVHRSAIVNRNRVTAMRAHRNGEYFLSLDGEKELKLSRKYKDNLSKLAERI